MLNINPYNSRIDQNLAELISSNHENFQDKRLEKIVEIAKAFAQNKEIARYHAIYLIQKQIHQEIT